MNIRPVMRIPEKDSRRPRRGPCAMNIGQLPAIPLSPAFHLVRMDPERFYYMRRRAVYASFPTFLSGPALETRKRRSGPFRECTLRRLA